MRTLSCSVGLLLLLCVYDCTAMPRAVDQMSPALCCFHFSTGRVPSNRVASITKTHSGCRQTAFVVTTVKGRQICVRHDEGWAQDLFRQ